MSQILVVSPVKEDRRMMASLLADPMTGGVVETGNLEQALVVGGSPLQTTLRVAG